MNKADKQITAEDVIHQLREKFLENVLEELYTLKEKYSDQSSYDAVAREVLEDAIRRIR
jgi:hypothetical protein